jgi:hypothetical protein
MPEPAPVTIPTLFDSVLNARPLGPEAREPGQ